MKFARLVRLAAPLIAASLLASGTVAAKEFTNLKIAEPQPAAGDLQPGLAVRYVFEKFDSLTDVENWTRGVKPVEGKPLPQLNYKVGDGEVLTSGKEDLVGAYIDGFIHLEKTGVYTFTAEQNDGLRLSIGGVKIHEDGNVLADRFSPALELKIEKAGWYPISLLYFEKRNTSTLQLFWQPPGTEDMVLVPAAAFAHVKGKTS
jgi:hypothetical protein